MRAPRDLQLIQLADGRFVMSWLEAGGDDATAPLAGGVVRVSPDAHERAVDDGFHDLGPAEAQVLQLALEGLSNAAIAARRGSRPRTIANQLARAYEKLGVSSRAEAAAGVDVAALARRVSAASSDPPVSAPDAPDPPRRSRRSRRDRR